MKQFKRFALVVLVVLTSSLPTNAYDFEVDGIYYNILSEENLLCEVTGCGVYLEQNAINPQENAASYIGDIVIPQSVSFNNNIYSVVQIGKFAFYNCGAMNSVSIPETITKIASQAFYECTGLSTVQLPNSITEIGSWAFFGCKNLKEVVLPIFLSEIESHTFYKCEKLNSINIPSSVYKIGESAFSYSKLSSVTTNAKYIGQTAFSDCTSLAYVSLPTDIEYVGAWAFDRTPWYNNLNDDIIYLGRVLYKCKNSYLYAANINIGTISISDYAFQGCQNLVALNIPNSVRYIGVNAFHTCTSLKSVKLPDELEAIESGTFYNCSNLKTIEIPEGVKYVGKSAFTLCKSLETIVLPNSIDSIGESIFSNCTALLSATLPCNINKIEQGIFSHCTSLMTIEIPVSVTSIGNYAFSNCRSLSEITIPRYVEKIGYEAFRNCNKIVSIVLPESLNNLGGYSFADCESLTEIDFPAFLTYIEGGAFKNCKELTQIKCKSDNPPYCEGRVFEGVEVSNCRLIVPVESGQAYFTTSPWSDFNIKYNNARCGSPEVKFNNELRHLVFTSDVEGAEYHYTLTSSDITQTELASEGVVDINGSYEITVYATAVGYEPSLPTKITLVWLTSNQDSDGIIPIVAKKAVVIKSVGGQIVVCGTERGERVALFTVDGRELVSLRASDGETALPCNLPSGEIVIVRYGDKSVKVKL